MTQEHQHRWLEVRPGVYRDSVTLLRVSRRLGALPGVDGALVAMATELNLGLLDGMGFTLPENAGPNDLVVAVRAADAQALAAARDSVDGLLAEASEPSGSPGLDGGTTAGIAGTIAPRTVGSAAARAAGHSRPTLALVSVPGPYAFAESMDALAAGLNVMVFSDNVPVAHEILLKEEAARRGLLVMGPDCGTAVVGGAGLGFANAVRPGPVGVVAASGTGAQQLMCLLDLAGVGVSHVLGVGGRDLSGPVSGRSTLQALTALDADPATELIVIVTKPPASAVCDLVREAVRRLSTRAVYAPLGPGNDDLTAVAERVIGLVGAVVPQWPCWPAPELGPSGRRERGGRTGGGRTKGGRNSDGRNSDGRNGGDGRQGGGSLRGLFVGGTLCHEAMLIATARLGPVRSNVPLRPDWAIDSEEPPPGHMMIDFGDDALTRGRAHPMIDPTLRLERLAAEAADPDCGVLLLDVVLGNAAEPDPSASLAPAVEAAVGQGPQVVVSLCGTYADPQDLVRQATALQAAGAAVFVSNAEATRHAVALAQVPTPAPAPAPVRPEPGGD